MREVDQAIAIIKAGGIVIYPTDTAFGIGCRIDDHKAVDRLFELRRRPITRATPVLVSSREQSLAYLSSPSKIVRRLMDDYWPGALTIVAPCKKELVYSPIRGNSDAIGMRMPDHQATLSIISQVGVPILGPSANFHGEKTPYRFEDLDPVLVNLVDCVVSGECRVKQASTVVDCTREPYRIIRKGAVELP